MAPSRVCVHACVCVLTCRVTPPTSKLAKPLLLVAVTFLLIVASALGCVLVGLDLGEGLWHSWLFTADPGSHVDVEGSGFRFVAFSTTIGGMCVFAVMVGIITDEIGERMDDLKKGKSRVLESGHTVMLGWSGVCVCVVMLGWSSTRTQGSGRQADRVGR